MLTRLGRIVLVAALLAGWQSALVHPLTHLDKNGGFVHLADGHPQPGKKKSDSAGLCDVLAALAACAAGSAHSFAAVVSSQKVLSYYSDTLRAAEAPPFLAQGPPAVL